jgi:hypothetical protein
MFRSAWKGLLLFFLLLSPAALSSARQESVGACQKSAQNPVAGLMSLPLQNNTSYGIGSDDRATADRQTCECVWSLPFKNNVGRVKRFGFEPVNMTAQFCGNAIQPEGAPISCLHPQIAFLFPMLPARI